MKSITRQIAFASLTTIILILVVGATAEAAKPKARLTYDSQTPKSVNVVYMNMPAASQILYVNKTSGKKFPPQKLRIEGNGTFSVPIGSLPAGEYYLLAQNSKRKYLAQTVTFYISRGLPGPEL